MQHKILPVFVLAFCSAFLHAQGTITTIGGGGPFQLTGIGGPATNVPLGFLQGVVADSQGNVYASDSYNDRIVKIAPSGVLTIFAGGGPYGVTGDGGPAANASLTGPGALSADGAGNIFFSDGGTIRKISIDGTISLFAGTYNQIGYSGDGGPATQAHLVGAGTAVDAKGNVYIADSGNSRIRKVTPQGIISTVAGNGQAGYTGDGVPATSSALNLPSAVAVDQNGVLYIADSSNYRIRRVGTDGIITTIAGGNGVGDSGDGGPATAAALNQFSSIALDSAGDLYLSESLGQRIRKITPDGIIRTIAGTGVANFTGDQGPASLATLNSPTGVSADTSGNIYIADGRNFRVRKIDPLGTMTTYAGNGNWLFAGDGGQALQAFLFAPWQVAVDPSGNVYFSDAGTNRVRKIATNGIITTVAGGSAGGFAGDGGPATQALLHSPAGIALDRLGNLYIADSGNFRVRKVDTNGTITTIAGNGTQTVNGNGDGGPAVDASFGYITDIAIDAYENLYIVDLGGLNPGSIRWVSPSGTISTFFTGHPTAVAVDAKGNVYISEVPSAGSGDVRRISPDGATSIVSGFTSPGKTAIDSQGNLYVSEIAYLSGVYSCTITMVSPSGATKVVISQCGPPQIAGPPPGPKGIALDSAGNLYFVFSNLIQKLSANPASGQPQPTLQMTLQPGYYTATVTLGQGQQPGYWGMQVLAPVGVLAGGFNLGGTIQQRSQPPGFGGIYVPSAQSVHLHVDAQAADGSSSSAVGLGVQLLDASNNPVSAEQFGGTSLDFTQPLTAGYYTIVVRGGVNSPNENFQMALGATQFAGGVVIGGYAAPNSTGFGGFYLSAPQQVTIQVLGQPSYGADGAGGLRLTLYDASRNVITTVP